ncbi:MAG: DUF2059 domain-containing protein [Deltaproteobacteria bacterium]|nr:DUF2059 domain-containing protein [Deltaproteobacteria bacterium]
MFGLLFLGFQSTAVVAAQPGPQPGAHKLDKKAPRFKEAQELTLLLMSKETFRATMLNTSTALLNSLDPTGTRGPEMATKLADAVNEILPFEEMVDWNAEIYSSRFTLEELRTLKKFYQTPVGKKLARSLPDIMGEVAKKMGVVMSERLPAALQKHGLAP